MHNDDDDNENEFEDLPPLPDPTGVTEDSSAAIGVRATATPEDPEAVSSELFGEEALSDADPPHGRPSTDVDAGHRDDDDSVEVVMPEPAQAAAAHASDPFLGRTFGGYELVEPIGRGGMGMVYKGVQVSLERPVAVKLLNKALVDSEEFIKRFQREARAMATIHHQNIVSVIDFGQEHGTWYMVAEFVDGTNLARMIREKLMVPAEDLAPLAVHCLSGLAYVGKSQVIHRDIKPDNILIDRDNVAKIADFGLAKDLSKEETDLTAAGSAMGTPSYMSPEQCMGHPLDGRSDIYSLGVTLYYALTGEKPFTGRSSFDIMTKQREYTPPPVHKVNPQVPRPISRLLEKMMAKSPASRYADAGACREAWLQVGRDLGYFGSVTRSGEYLFPTEGEDNAGADDQLGVAYPADEPAGRPPIPDLNGMAGTGSAELPPEVVETARGAGSGSETIRRTTAARHREPKTAGTARRSRDTSEHRTRTDRSVRPRTDRARRAGTDREQALTCSRCGAINRPTRTTCDKCGNPLREVAEVGSSEGQMREADRLFKHGQFRESAIMYAQLADHVDDRRQRTVLRTKEREARQRLEAAQLGDVNERVESLVAKGKYQEAEQMLVRLKREATATSSIMSTIDQDLLRIRKAATGRRRRRRFLIVVVVLAALATAAWFTRERWLHLLPFEIPGLARSSGGAAAATGDEASASPDRPSPAAEPTEAER